MRDPKSLYILIFALSLVTISFVLISIWGYHFYIQPKENGVSQPINKTPGKIQRKQATDSLKNLQDTANVNPESVIQQNNLALDSTDTSDKELELKLLEYNKLKEDISTILKNKTSSTKDLSEANEKIAELQKNIDDLRNQNNAVAKENAKLNKMLEQFISENKKKGKSSANNSAKDSPHTKTAIPSVLVSRLKFFAVDENKSLTRLASNAVRWDGSFEISVNSDKITSQEIFVVIVQPTGKVLLNSSSEPGTFEANSERKVYSAVLHFDVVKDNHRRLYFSIDSHSFHKGSYKMLIYYSGILIGRMDRSLG